MIRAYPRSVILVALPEGRPLPGFAPEQGRKMPDAVAPVFPPAHPGALESLPSHLLARRLHWPRADVPTLRQIFRTLHALHIVAEVLQHLFQLGAQRRPPRRPV